ncbi:uncharacterized mitochondrial protein AtMg00810-like [Nicotiana tomentosiformis]|uniref:uncharacterized mitochondrial protein AtMg00810-like n=1 Tax=Nicotiana tomentosiformis TaxID=4098 RepID=UPI00388C59FC
MSNDITNINATKYMLTSKFDMKDLGVADLILGIKIYKTPQGLALSQDHYIQTILGKFRHLDFKVTKSSIDVNLALAKNKDQSILQLDYARIVVSEAFQVATMIEKLPPSWRDFKNYLKHKHKEMKLEDLVIRLKTEEDNKITAKKSRGNSMIMGANIIEETAPKSKKRKRSSRQTKEQNKKKFKGNCYNCEKSCVTI